MILAIKKFFEDNLNPANTESVGDSQHRIELATAALLFELMKTDANIDERENQAVSQALQATFGLSGKDLEQIITLAAEESRESTSLFEFTSLVNSSYSYEQRVELLENLWRVAFADNQLDRYEEAMIRKVADLIYVNHSDFIRSKLKIRDELS